MVVNIIKYKINLKYDIIKEIYLAKKTILNIFYFSLKSINNKIKAKKVEKYLIKYLKIFQYINKIFLEIFLSKKNEDY